MKVSVLAKCPKCGAEVEFFLKRKPHDPYLLCPQCNNLFTKNELPPEERNRVRVKYMEDIEEKNDNDDVAQPHEHIDEDEKQEQAIQKEVSKQRQRRFEPLFAMPKEPTEIIAEILLDWGCKDDFVRRVTEYINVKGYFDAGWLMSMLLKANTGRRFTEQEAFMVVDMIMSALEREKKMAEETGKAFPIGIVPLRGGGGGGTYYSHPIPLHQSSPQYMTMYHASPTPPPHGQAIQQLPTTAQYPQITPQQIQEMIRQAIAEQKKADVIEELKKMIYEIEKRRIEDKAEVEKKLADTTKTVRDELTKMLENSLSEIKDMIASLQSPQQTQAASASIDKRDLELMRIELEKKYIQEISNLEKKLLEAKTEAEKKELLGQLQELKVKLDTLERAASTPISPEGWKSDEARLVAELGGRFFEIVKDRKPVEYLVRIIPQKPMTEEKKITETSLEELIKESGGVVE
jgi:uncharacterized Zn finger protein (UPF0148 family)